MHLSLTILCFMQLSIVLSVEGVSMTINPSFMVVGSSSANPVRQLELRCFSDGTDHIETIYRLDMSRRRSSDPDFVNIASIDGYKIIKSFPLDMKSPNATGSLEHVPGEPPTSGTLTVTMDGEGLTCNDQAEFRCTMTYKKMGTPTAAPVSQSNNFTVITAPNDVRIIDAMYEENGVMKRLENDKSFKVGTRIMYRCSANTGSDSSVSISWERSPVMGASTNFVPYIPADDIVQDPVISTGCSNTQTSSMYYNLTSSDFDGIIFRCKVRSFLNGEWYQSTSIERRTLADHTSGNAGGKAGGPLGSPLEAGIIAGAVVGSVVVIVVIIILMYLWIRKRRTKEPPRTTEEVESLDPPPTGNIYSRPEKKKRTNLGTKVGDGNSRKPPEPSDIQYADLDLPKQPRPIPRKSKAKVPPVEYTEIRLHKS
ncbi:hypothetical protein CHS0354_040459 [Potamilus streckersoni]|uniref:Ig-like domain-containing protein n=1 Tax=Potamilus streckersoni TaxID=2493646 RepID=A0AAE0T0R2_9BIVA|nr:hypothetical protein CHS0354_040459 [Potamilus streckersoni]